jgi:hypothetical protein
MQQPQQQHNKNGANGKQEKAPPDDLEATTKASETSVVLSDDDYRPIQIAEQEMNEVKQKLGNLRAQYVVQEAALLEAIKKSEQDYEATIKMMGKKNGVSFKDGASVHFNASTKTFTHK